MMPERLINSEEQKNMWLTATRCAILAAILIFTTIGAWEVIHYWIGSLSNVTQQMPDRRNYLLETFYIFAGSVTIVLLIRLTKITNVRTGVIALGLLLTALMAVGSGNVIAILVVCWICVTAWVTGRWLLGIFRVRSNQSGEIALISVGIGLGVLSFVAYGLGMAGQLTQGMAIASLLLLDAPILFYTRDIFGGAKSFSAWLNPRNSSIDGWFSASVSGLVLGFYTYNLIGGLNLDVMSDAVHAHLAVARAFAENGNVTIPYYILLSSRPLGGQMLFTLGMLLQGIIAAKMIHFAVGLLAALTVLVLGNRITNSSRIGVLGAAVFYTTPVVSWLSWTAYVDLFTAFYAALVVFCLVQWIDEQKIGWMCLIGIFLGLGYWFKPAIEFIAPGIGFAIILLASKDHNPWHILARRLAILSIMSLAGLIAAISFSDALLNQVEANPMLAFLLSRASGQSTTYDVFDTFGIGRGWQQFLMMPWELMVHSFKFGENGGGFLGLSLFGLVPLLLVRKRLQRKEWIMVVLAVTTLLIWAFIVQYIRYLLPILVVLAPFAASGYYATHDWIRNVLNPKAARVFQFFPIALLALSPAGLAETHVYFPGRLPLDVAFGLQSPSSFVGNVIPAYRALSKLGKIATRPGSRVASMGVNASLYSPLPLVTFQMPGADFLLSAGNPQELRNSLDRNNFEFIIIDNQAVPPQRQGAIILSPSFLSENTHLVYSSGGVYLYRLVPPGQPQPLGPEILGNPGFEEMNGGTIRGWSSYGTPNIDSTGRESHDGNTAVLADGQSGFFQLVPAEAGRSYELRYFARGESRYFTRGLDNSASARMQINWLGANNELLAASIEVVRVGTGFKECWMRAEAPPGTVFAQVYVDAHGDSAPIWFDDYSLREVISDD